MRIGPARTAPRSPSTAAAACLLLALIGCMEQETAASEAPRIADAGWAEGAPGLFGRAYDPSHEDEAGLGALGYAGGYELAPAEAGVTRLDASRSEPGATLLLSGHAPEAQLVDAQGAVLHRWSFAYAEVPGAPPIVDEQHVVTWRTGVVLPDGGFLAVFEGHAMVRLGRDSSLIWAYGGRPHHDLEITPEGEILVLTRRDAIVPWVHPSLPVVEDFLTRLSLEDGSVISQLSLLECFERSEHRALIDERAMEAGDVLHTNAIELLDDRLAARIPAFRRGNVLISMRHTHALAVVDPKERRIAWAKTGAWRLQHDPTVLDDGRILLFDNAGNGSSSQVIEIDPESGAIEWAWRGDPPESFFTLYCGSAQRLPGGNTLIAESCRGRALEVTPTGEIVWEYLNPKRAGESGELIAAIFEARRLPLERIHAWLQR